MIIDIKNTIETDYKNYIAFQSAGIFSSKTGIRIFTKGYT